MACINEKLTAGIAGSGVAAGGVGLIASTATGPAFFAALVGWLATCAGYGLALSNLSICLATNGYPEMAAAIKEKADAIAKEIEDLKAWARSVGAPI